MGATTPMQDRLQVLKEPAEAPSNRLGEASNPFQSGNGLERATLVPIDHSYLHTGHSQGFAQRRVRPRCKRAPRAILSLNRMAHSSDAYSDLPPLPESHS